MRKSATDLIFDDLMSGETINATIKNQAKYGVNQIPDVIRKLRNKGIPVNTRLKRVVSRGRATKVADYYLDENFIKEQKNK